MSTLTAPQLSFWQVVPEEPKEARKYKKAQAKHEQTVSAKLAAMHALHEELNHLLYTTGEKPAINSPADAAALIEYEMSLLPQEELWILILNIRNRVMQITKVYKGSVSSSQIRIGEVFKAAIALNGSAVIIAHNHPSGDPTPSPDDVAVTRAFVQAGNLLDVQVLDHVIIGRHTDTNAPRWCSLKERGLGFS